VISVCGVELVDECISCAACCCVLARFALRALLSPRLIPQGAIKAVLRLQQPSPQKTFSTFSGLPRTTVDNR
jgi:hypothetical protein